jgi:putative PIN family toxin of toxin-antitoxin system
MRVVLDTNVVVSARLVREGPSAAILELALLEKITMFVSPAVMAEYRRVLFEPRFRLFRLSSRTIHRTLAGISRVSRMVTPTETLRVSEDETDNRIYECASKGKARFIITGNVAHFPRPYRFSRIVTPRRFLEIWNQS